MGAIPHPLWHDGALDDPACGGQSVVWSIATTGPFAHRAVAGVPATPEDRTDAARTPDGGERLLRHRLARALIARLSNTRAENVRLSRTAPGAPIVVAPGGWHLSLSGRDGACLIGVARQPIAVDREPLDDAPPLRDMLAPAEIAAMDRLPAADRPHDWLRRWTIKEAHAKLIGDPLPICPEQIATHLIDAERATATFAGVSHCRTRRTATAFETVALWA